MLTSVLTSIIAYTGTNIDDIFVLMILLAQNKAKGPMIAGHFLGVGLLTAIAIPVVFIALGVFIILNSGLIG